jgi:hypothetical protein
LIVVVGYWLFVIFGAAEPDALDGDAEAATGDAQPGFLAGLGLDGVPVTVVLSLLIALSWFVSLVGTALLASAGVPTVARIALSFVTLAAALVAAFYGTRLLVAPLRRLLPQDKGASRGDFVGRLCVIRTGRVGRDFGQAEVTAADGSSAVVQVRQAGQDQLAHGTTALIYDYDVDGEFFWVAPADIGLTPPTDHKDH